MRVPKLNETRQYTEDTAAFAGIRRVGQVRDGEFTDAINVTNDEYPYLTVREERGVAYAGAAGDTALLQGIFNAAGDRLGAVRSGKIWINGLPLKYSAGQMAQVDIGDSTNQQTVILMGAYLLFFPALKYLNAIAISYRTSSDPFAEWYEIVGTTSNYGSITCPEMDIMFSSGNRLWGAKYGSVTVNNETRFVNEIYASELGDFNGWETGDGADKAWTASVASNGKFTGGCELNGHPVFFKEDSISDVYGNYPSNFQITTSAGAGVKGGCARTICVYNGTAYYVSQSGVYAYGGGAPVCISENFEENAFAMRMVLGGLTPDFINGGGAGVIFEGKYRVCTYLANGAGWRTLVYDLETGTWLTEIGNFDTSTTDTITQFVTGESADGADNVFYTVYTAAGDRNVYELKKSGQHTSADANGVKWAVITGDIGYRASGSPVLSEHKTLLRVTVRMSTSTGASVKYSLRYDDEYDANHLPVWRDEHTVTTAATKTVTLSVRPRRCDHFQIKIEGTKKSTIYGITRVYDRGSDYARV